MKKFIAILKILIISICTVLTLSFMFTMMCGIVNHGNIIGTIGCLIVIFSILLYDKYKKIKPVRVITKSFLLLAGVFAIYCAVISSFMISGMLNIPQKAFQTGTDGVREPETVIVLGCKTINGNPSAMLAARLDTAAEYLLENPQAVCVVSGGRGGDEIEPEAVTMERYLISKGIESDRLYKECNSSNTQENLLYSAQMINEQKLPKNVIVVSESYHVYRGTRNAEINGLNAAALPAPTNTVWALPSYWLREIFAVTRDFIADMF